MSSSMVFKFYCRVLSGVVLFFVLILPVAIAANNLGFGNYYYRSNPEIDFQKIKNLYETPTRKVINLNGFWDVINRKNNKTAKLIVPGCYDYEGEVEFNRFFELDSSFLDRSINLIVLGINNRCKIFINDEFITSHAGGHTAFLVELSRDKIILPGKNKINILVENNLLPRKSLPLKHAPGLGKNYGGIFRDIFILGTPSVSITQFNVMSRFSEDLTQCQLKISSAIKMQDYAIDYENTEQPVELIVEMYDPEGKKLISRSTPEKLIFEKKVLVKEIELPVKNFEFWSPGRPVLYKLKFMIQKNREIIDEITTDYGLASITISDSKINLNGKPIPLMGLSWYEEYPDFGGSADLSFLESEINRIKTLGVNAIRIVGTPPHPYLFNLCNKTGVLVFCEMPLSFIPKKRLLDNVFNETAAIYCQEIVEWNANNACVVGWGLGMDIQADSVGVDFLNSLKTIISKHSLKPIYTVYNFYLPQEIPDIFDLVFLNLFGQNSDEIKSRSEVQKLAKTKGLIYILGFPFSADGALSPNTSGTEQSDTRTKAQMLIKAEEIQAYNLNHVLATAGEIEQLAGVFVHTYADWHNTLPNLFNGADDDKLINRTGIFSYNREKRLAGEVVESIFSEGQTKKISARVYTFENPNVYPVLGVTLILLFLFNFNRSRKFRGNLRRIFLYPHGFYMELRENRKISNSHTVLLSIIISVTLSIIASSIFYNFRDSLLFDNFLNLFISSSTLKTYFIGLTWHPVLCIIFLIFLFYLVYGLFILSLKIVSMLLGQFLPVSQFITLVFWINACFIWLLPLVPIFYRVINQTTWGGPAFLLLALFLIWFTVRLFRGIKVIFAVSLFKSLIIVSILGFVVFGGIGWYLDKHHAIFEYLPMYWEVVLGKFKFMN